MAYTALQQLIFERIARDGPIPFAEYMRMALYEPGYGYYVTGAAKMGWEGDYFTSTDVSALFATCMGRQLQQMWEKLGRPAKFRVLEQGAGRGRLEEGIRAWASREAAGFNAALDYRSEDIRTGQDANVALLAESPGHKNQLDISNSQSLQTPSVILSNELIDAFPVHIVESRQGRLYEVYVELQNGHLGEVLDEPSSPALTNYLDSFNIPWQTFGENWRAEINLDALRWMEGVARLLHKGFLLTIDYGDKARALYTRARPRGTLVCYFRHRLTEQPLLQSGEQDITAHVNFSALINAGRRNGFRLNTFTTQRLWLESMGIDEELEQIRARNFAEADRARGTDQGQIALFKLKNLRQGIAALTDPLGMGNFKVLILRR